METIVKFLDDLMKPGNGPFLAAFIVILLGLAVFLAFWVIAFVKKDRLNLSRKIGPLWIHISGGPNDPKTDPRRYRKLVYAKVNFLSNRKTKATPFYVRRVDRLEGEEGAVAVFDEVVYTTLKLFPEKRALTPEQETSSGVIDPRVLIPWVSALGFREAGAQHVAQMVNIEAKTDSDTLMVVSHFMNGLQGNHQDFATYVDEDAESLRLIVDFSSIPAARERIGLERTQVLFEGRPVETDDLKYERCGESIYMAHCRNARKGYLLKMAFTFKDWEGAGFGGA